MSRLLTITAVSTCLLAVAATSAGAAGKQYCVWNTATSPIPATCEHNYSWSSTGVNDAVEAAAEQDLGRSEVLIGPGVLEVPITAPIVIAPPSGEPVDVRGSGAGATKLQQTAVFNEHFTAVQFQPLYMTDSTVSDMTIAVPGSPSTVHGMRALGGSISNVRFEVIGDSESPHYGLITESYTPTTVEDSEFHVMGTGFPTVGWYVDNNSTVTRSTFTASGQPGNESQIGVFVDSTDGDGSQRALLTRSSFDGFEQSIVQHGGELRAHEVLIELGTYGLVRGVHVHGGDFRGDGLTIVGEGNNAFGVRAHGSAVTGDAYIDISNSIIQVEGSSALDVSCFSYTPGVANVSVRNSLHNVWLFSSALGVGSCVGSSAGSIDRSVTPAVFAAGFRPTAGSPVVDAGNADSDRIPPKLDLAGNQRFIDGDGDGQAVIDKGAFEYQLPVPDPGGPPAGPPSVAAPILTIQLGKTVGKFKIHKRKPKAFALGRPGTKPRLPVTTNLDAVLVLSLAKARGGYKSGKSCKLKKPAKRTAKRCDLPLKGTQSVAVKAGTSFLTFSGRWNRKKLAPGKYVLTVGARSIQESKKATLNVVR